MEEKSPAIQTKDGGAALREERLDKAVAFFKRRGNAIPFVETLRDLNKKEKADFLDDVMRRVKGVMKAKNNPYRMLILFLLPLIMLGMTMNVHAQNKPSYYPNGWPNGVVIQGMPVLNTYPGDVYWVDSGTGSNSYPGTFRRPFSTIDYAVGRCTASNGDIIMVKPGHTESITGSGTITFDVAGVTVVFMGSGSLRPTITWSTATTARMIVSAADVTLTGSAIFDMTGYDAVAIGIHVSGANFKMLGDYTGAFRVIQADEDQHAGYAAVYAVVLEEGADNHEFRNIEWISSISEPNLSSCTVANAVLYSVTTTTQAQDYGLFDGNRFIGGWTACVSSAYTSTNILFGENTVYNYSEGGKFTTFSASAATPRYLDPNKEQTLVLYAKPMPKQATNTLFNVINGSVLVTAFHGEVTSQLTGAQVMTITADASATSISNATKLIAKSTVSGNHAGSHITIGDYGGTAVETANMGALNFTDGQEFYLNPGAIKINIADKTNVTGNVTWTLRFKPSAFAFVY